MAYSPLAFEVTAVFAPSTPTVTPCRGWPFSSVILPFTGVFFTSAPRSVRTTNSSFSTWYCRSVLTSTFCSTSRTPSSLAVRLISLPMGSISLLYSRCILPFFWSRVRTFRNSMFLISRLILLSWEYPFAETFRQRAKIKKKAHLNISSSLCWVMAREKTPL